MNYLILDVFYFESGEKTNANAVGIIFSGVEKISILCEYQIIIEDVAPYQSGQFYKREMPCLIALINQVKESFDIIIIDGFVYLDGSTRAGLGKYLYENLKNKKPIIGIAKNRFHGISEEYKVYRGKSKHPLYVTTHDYNLTKAKLLVENLEGEFRIPNIILKVDKLSRNPMYLS